MEKLNPKKVLIASSVHVWMDTRIYFKEAISLANNGFFVEMIARKSDKQHVEVHPNIVLNTLVEKDNLSRLKACRLIYKQAMASDAMYYHFHDPELLPVAWLLKKRKRHARIIFDMHENFPKALLTKAWMKPAVRKIVAQLVRFLEPKMLASCDGVIFAEESYKKDYPFLRKTVDIYNLPHNSGEIVDEEKKGLVLTYVGSITKIRGAMEMLRLLEALQPKHSKARLQLIGPIEPPLKEEMLQYIERHQLGEYVRLYDRLSYEKIWTELAKTTIGLCLLHPVPNYMESMPTKFYEYMAASVPILATNVPLWTNFLQENKAGWSVDPFDSIQIAKDIMDKYDTTGDFLQMGRQGREAFLRKYSWQQEEQKLIEFYSEMGCD